MANSTVLASLAGKMALNMKGNIRMARSGDTVGKNSAAFILRSPVAQLG